MLVGKSLRAASAAELSQAAARTIPTALAILISLNLEQQKMTPYQRVSKQMLQMFGPQWTEKFGLNNPAWEERLNELQYAEISAGLRKVLHGALKFYEIDLPRFIELCRPPRAPYSQGEIKRMAWTEGMCEDELQMHFYANQRMIIWCVRHPKYGMPPHSKADEIHNFTKEQNKALWEVARKISHDFFLMREEIGAENVPQEDFLKALEQNWSRIAT
jgi:hypothetical protein